MALTHAMASPDRTHSGTPNPVTPASQSRRGSTGLSWPSMLYMQANTLAAHTSQAQPHAHTHSLCQALNIYTSHMHISYSSLRTHVFVPLCECFCSVCDVQIFLRCKHMRSCAHTRSLTHTHHTHIHVPPQIYCTLNSRHLVILPLPCTMSGTL